MIDTVYILSAGRSGSTLLDLILGSHSRAVAVSELTQLPGDVHCDERCTCGAPIRECSFWRAVAARVQSVLGVDLWRDPFSLDLGFVSDPRRRRRPPLTDGYERAWKLRHALVYLGEWGVPLPRWTRARFDQGIANTLELHRIIRDISGRPVVVDASKSYHKGLALYRARPENTRLILLSRNGQASFYSRLRDGYDRAQSLRAWRNYYRHALPLLRRLVAPEHVIRAKYEDLATDPAGVIARICAFAGLEYEPAMLELGRATHHVTSGNDMRLSADTRIRLDTAWQTGLKAADRRFFETCAGALNRHLGYE